MSLQSVTAKVKSGRLASLCGLLIIWPLIVVAILVKVRFGGEEIWRYDDRIKVRQNVKALFDGWSEATG